MAPSVLRSVLRHALAAGPLICLALPILVGLPALALAQDGETLAPPTAPLPPVSGVGDLPRDLSPWGMFVNADPLVKAVLIGLVFASIVTWTVWLAKTIELMVARRRVRSALRALTSVRSVEEAAQKLG